ncbi:tyrosine-type recombinase/integrase [Marispirochaeta sp.]|uniref:tyrosine-type recombinase/integrase n=1 Tax=Marispirochaeta sp. TaxID=2038653 RepID=UPI0029C8BB39|nr:tyrosine-type recombinase/integrase [Marispirochaeta sp.]
MPRRRGSGKPYRFKTRKTKSGDIYYATFRAMPGKWISTGTTDLKEAERWAANYEISIVPTEQQTLAEFADRFYIPGKCPWLRRMKAKGKTFTVNHLKKMRGDLDNYILPEFGNLMLSAITQRDIDDYLIDLKSKRYRRPLMADAKNKVLISLRHVMKEAVAQGLIERDPTQGIVWFKDTEETEQEVFSPEELRKLFPPALDEMVQIWQTLEWAAYFMVMGSCGLRPQEVGALTWGKWSRSLHGLAITHKIDPGTKKRVKGTKTGYSKAVALPRRAEEILLLHEATTENTDPEDLIFTPKAADGGISAESANKHFKASCERAGLDRRERTPYNLRHSFNTYALQLLDRKEVQCLMGHRTNAMTQRYDHPSDQQLIERIPAGVWEKIDKLWG